MQPTVHDLLPEEQESLSQAMETIDGMSEDERRHFISNVVVVSLYYRRRREPKVLDDFARNVLRSIRLHASPTYRKAVIEARPPDLTRPPIKVKELFDALPGH